MLQGGMASGFTNTNLTTTNGSISLTNTTRVCYTSAQREMIRFNMGNDNTTKQVGINIYQPVAVLHIKNSGIDCTSYQ